MIGSLSGPFSLRSLFSPAARVTDPSFTRSSRNGSGRGTGHLTGGTATEENSDGLQGRRLFAPILIFIRGISRIRRSFYPQIFGQKSSLCSGSSRTTLRSHPGQLAPAVKRGNCSTRLWEVRNLICLDSYRLFALARRGYYYAYETEIQGGWIKANPSKKACRLANG